LNSHSAASGDRFGSAAIAPQCSASACAFASFSSGLSSGRGCVHCVLLGFGFAVLGDFMRNAFRDICGVPFALGGDGIGCRLGLRGRRLRSAASHKAATQISGGLSVAMW